MEHRKPSRQAGTGMVGEAGVPDQTTLHPGLLSAPWSSLKGGPRLIRASRAQRTNAAGFRVGVIDLLEDNPDMAEKPFIVSGAAKQRSSRCAAALIITSCASVSLTLIMQPFLSSRRPGQSEPLTRTSPGFHGRAALEQVFDVAEAEREPEVQPNRLVNDLRREPAVARVADFLRPLGYCASKAPASGRCRDNAVERSRPSPVLRGGRI